MVRRVFGPCIRIDRLTTRPITVDEEAVRRTGCLARQIEQAAGRQLPRVEAVTQPRLDQVQFFQGGGSLQQVWDR